MATAVQGNYPTLIIYGVCFMVCLHVAALGFWVFKVFTTPDKEQTLKGQKGHWEDTQQRMYRNVDSATGLLDQGKKIGVWKS